MTAPAGGISAAATYIGELLMEPGGNRSTSVPTQATVTPMGVAASAPIIAPPSLPCWLTSLAEAQQPTPQKTG